MAEQSKNQPQSVLRSSKSGWDGKLRHPTLTENAESEELEADSEESDQEGNPAQTPQSPFYPARVPPPTGQTGTPHRIPHPAPENQRLGRATAAISAADNANSAADNANSAAANAPALTQDSASTSNVPPIARVQQGPTVPGEDVAADEDLLADLDPGDTEEIDLVHCRVASIERLVGLDRFTKLRRLCLRQNSIEDMVFLPREIGAALEELDLYDNLISHIRGIEGFEKLRSLDLSFNKIKHIKRIGHLKLLTDLYFVQNKISTIEGLEGLEILRNLELGGNRIKEIEGLNTLTGLEELWLGKNKIVEIKNLESLSRLKILSIQSNRITELKGLESLVELEELHISHNAITELKGLEKTVKLRVIDISMNKISKLQGLENLHDLEEFWASGCLFNNFDDVSTQLGNKSKLETVYFEANPLQLRQPALYRNKVRLALPNIKQIDATFVQ